MPRLSYLLCFITVMCITQALEYTISTVNQTDLNEAADLPSRNPGSRIVGGTDTSIENFPYTVQVGHRGSLFCGGSLITARHVLSAAHCFVNQNGNVISPRRLTIRAGSSKLNSGGQSLQVSLIVVHPLYDRVTEDADVTVLVLAAAVGGAGGAAVALLPAPGAVVPDQSPLIHVGWGHTSDGGDFSETLQQVTVWKVPRVDCELRYAWLAAIAGAPFRVTENMICAGVLGVGGADACQGDSGGPLILAANPRVVVGITSWGFGCGQPEFPGVSARVSNFTAWIGATVNQFNTASPLVLTCTVLLLTSVFASLNIYTHF